MAGENGVKIAQAGLDGEQPLSVAEVERLYTAHARRVERIVRGIAHVTRPVLEDACQFAWVALLHRRESVDRASALSWLTTTAIHEACRLSDHYNRERSLDDQLERAPAFADRRASGAPETMLELREQLAQIKLLPSRQQRLVWLRGAGFSYAEMAAREQCTSRTVQRQLSRASHRLGSSASLALAA